VTPGRAHLASLDVFRGFAVAGMILVNNPGNWGSTFEPLTHANWNGCTFADLVFPFFVFILGAAMPFAFARRAAGGERGLAGRVLRRGGWLLVLGLVLNIVAAAPNVAAMRVPGVLQRIGLVYMLAAPIVIALRPPWRLVVAGALVGGHWALLMAPIDATAGVDQAHNLASVIDRAVFGRHLLSAAGDPEGLLGTVPALATALLGSIAGDWLRAGRSASARVSGLVAGGVLSALAGVLWAAALPLNKILWTGSFVLFTAGIATLTLAVCHLLLDEGGARWWTQPFVWLGVNPLAIYFLAELLGHLLDAAWTHGDAAAPTTLRTWMFWDVLTPVFPGVPAEWLSLAFALLTVSLWIGVAGGLYHRGVRIRV
jgi:predicted acyltransferase